MGAEEEAHEAVGLAIAAKQKLKKKTLSHLTLHEAVEYAMRPMDVSGAPPAPEQYVSFARIWKTLSNHPDLESQPRQIQMTIETSTPVEVEHVENQMRRRSKDALRRAIKANQFIRREGATKGARYYYDSSLYFEKLKLILPIVMGEIMRTPTSYNDEITSEDLRQRLGYTSPSNIYSALHNLEKNAAIGGYLGDGSGVTGYEKIELKPGIWKVHPFGKETYNFTLSEHTSVIFADLALNMFLLQAELDDDSPLEPSEKQSKWVDMFGAIPLPEGAISKSLIVEIALWNLYHSLPRMASTEVTAPDILRDSELQTISVATVMEEGIDKARSEGEPLSERDQSRGLDQSALEALSDDEEFKDMVTRLTLTYLKEKKD